MAEVINTATYRVYRVVHCGFCYYMCCNIAEALRVAKIGLEQGRNVSIDPQTMAESEYRKAFLDPQMMAESEYRKAFPKEII